MPPKFGIFYRRELTITSTNNFLDMKKFTFILTSMLFLLVGGGIFTIGYYAVPKWRRKLECY